VQEKLSTIEKITKARIQLLRQQPFLGYIVMNLNFKENEIIAQKTMAVDARGNVYYSPKFVNSLSEEVLMSVISHESLHLALLHLTRVGTRDREIFNYAADLAVNTILKNNNMQLDKDFIVANDGDDYKYKNILIKNVSKKNSEQIYDELMSQIPKIKINLSDLFKKGFDNHIYDKLTKGMSPEQKKDLEDKWKSILTEALFKSKIAGKEPFGMERYVNELLDSKLDWKSLLKKYVVNEIPVDYEWRRPNRRSVACNCYMPGVKKETIKIGIAVDTSGSISKIELTEFLSEIVSIVKSYENVNMRLVTHDYVIHDDLTVDNGNIEKIMNLNPKGGGGTEHLCVFEHAKKNNYKVLICFTDGYSNLDSIPIDSYDFSTIIVLTEKLDTNFNSNKAIIIHLDLSGNS